MKTIKQIKATFLIAFAMLISACAASASVESPPQADSTLAPTASAVANTATPRPTQGPTSTVWPPVFDLYSLTDMRDYLDSLVVTVTVKNTVNGDTTQIVSTIGFIKEPYSAYNQNQYEIGSDRTYLLDGSIYEVTNTGDWYISTGNGDGLFSRAEIPTANTHKLVEAQFVAEEEYQGIPAYHFVLDPANCAECNTNYQLEGDFYLAKDGNYVLYSHWKETSAQGNFSQVYEVIEELSSINQLTEITIPADMQDMVTAAELPTELGLPLPTGSSLDGMIRYSSCCGVDQYTFATPKTSIDAFLDYYRNLAPTNGWTVSHVGHVSVHESDCEFSRECVIINKAGTQVILYYNGGPIRVEFDWPHLFGPL
jgi:hypothetical protein